VLGTIGRAGEVMRLFNGAKPEWGVTEMAACLELPKSTAHDVLTSLAEVGLIRRTESNRYRLGWGLLSLSQVLLATTEFRNRGLQVMSTLVDELGETVHLGVLDGPDVVYLEKLQGTRAVQVSLSGIGRRVPAHCTALGKTILADLSWDEVQANFRLPTVLPGLTANSKTRLAELRTELAQVRRQGYAYDVEEAAPEICCVGAPIRDAAMGVVAALSVTVPAYRFVKEKAKYTKCVTKAAASMSFSESLT
jgi:IclR family transcriptional regulator, KDG regulon repressor